VPFLVFLRRRPSTIILEAPLENPVVLNPSRGKSNRRKRYNMLMSWNVHSRALFGASVARTKKLASSFSIKGFQKCQRILRSWFRRRAPIRAQLRKACCRQRPLQIRDRSMRRSPISRRFIRRSRANRWRQNSMSSPDGPAPPIFETAVGER